MGEIKPRDISHELWRDYRFIGKDKTVVRYKIKKPKLLYVGNTTHRIVDSDGVTHILPAPGYHGCAVRFKNPEGTDPCRF